MSHNIDDSLLTKTRRSKRGASTTTQAPAAPVPAIQTRQTPQHAGQQLSLVPVSSPVAQPPVTVAHQKLLQLVNAASQQDALQPLTPQQVLAPTPQQALAPTQQQTLAPQQPQLVPTQPSTTPQQTTQPTTTSSNSKKRKQTESGGKKKGRVVGAFNWRAEDYQIMLDVIEIFKPNVNAEWAAATAEINKRLGAINRGERSEQAIRTRFLHLINGPNTGAGGASLVQARARKINKAIMKAVEVVELGIDVDEEEEEEGEEEEDGGDDIRTVLSEAEGGGINKATKRTAPKNLELLRQGVSAENTNRKEKNTVDEGEEESEELPLRKKKHQSAAKALNAFLVHSVVAQEKHTKFLEEQQRQSNKRLEMMSLMIAQLRPSTTNNTGADVGSEQPKL